MDPEMCFFLVTNLRERRGATQSASGKLANDNKEREVQSDGPRAVLLFEGES